MSNCDNAWVDQKVVFGSADSKEKAEKDFSNKLNELLEPLQKEVCKGKVCDATEVKKVCAFAYSLEGPAEAKEVAETIFVFDPKTEKYQQVKGTKKVWEKTQTLKYGCWCFEEGFLESQ